MEKYKPNFFHVNHLFLKYGGFWRPEEHTTIQYTFYKMYQSVVLLVALVFNFYSVIFDLIENINRFSVLVVALNIGMMVFLAMIKVIFWLTNSQHIKSIMNTLENNAFYYETIDDFDQKAIIKVSKRTGTIFTLTLWMFAEVTLAFGYVPACTVSISYFFRDRPISDVSTFQTLPYYTHIPFVHDTAFKYFLACIVQWIALHHLMIGFIGVDGLFMNLVNLVGEQMIILQGAFKTLRKRCAKKIIGPALTTDSLYNSDELEEMMMSEMKKCVRHLQLLLRSCCRIEETFKFICLCQALGSSYILCSILLVLSMSTIPPHEFMQNIIYLVGAVIQLGLYCWSGNELTLKVEQVSTGLWESDWLQTRQPFKRCMLITMMRLQRPLYLTAGKFAPLTLTTEISVLKASYSYFTVLKTMSN